LQRRGLMPDKGASRLTGRNFLRPHYTAWMCHDSRPTPLANLAAISQPNSVNIRQYLLTNRRCLSNESSSRQYHYFPHGVLSCSGTEDEDTLHYPYTSRSKSAMSYRSAILLISFLSRCFFCFALLLLGYPNAQIFVYFCRPLLGVR
jgi:hypothetical protein